MTLLRPRSHGIVDVQPLRPRPGQEDRTWSCSVCGRSHRIRTSWVLTYRHDDGPDLRFILCEPCALERRPVRMVIDLTRLDRLDQEDELIQHIELLRVLRDEPNRDELPIRDEDIERLAASKGLEVGQLIARWEAIGVARRQGAYN